MSGENSGIRIFWMYLFCLKMSNNAGHGSLRTRDRFYNKSTQLNQYFIENALLWISFCEKICYVKGCDRIVKRIADCNYCKKGIDIRQTQCHDLLHKYSSNLFQFSGSISGNTSNSVMWRFIFLFKRENTTINHMQINYAVNF